MPVDVRKATEEVFAHEHGLRLYAAVANLSKDRFSTTELAQASGVQQSYVSKELAFLKGIGLIEKRAKNDYERVPDAFWTAMGDLADAWGV